MVDRPKALIFGRNEGAPYHPLSAVEADLVSLFSKDFEVRVSDRSESLLALGQGGYRLLIAVDDRWTDPQRPENLAAVEWWLRRGGSLLMIHNGICWAGDPGWRRIAGGRFTGHGPAKTLTFRRRDSQFELFEEPYRFSIPWFSGNKVVASYEDGGRSWPAFWTRRVGKGQFGYALPGHSSEVFQNPFYRMWLVELAQRITLSG